MTTTRPVRADDVELLLDLQHRHQRAVLGRPDTVLSDVQDSLADPDLDPSSSVVLDDDGRALGCALVFHDGQTDRADVDVVVDPGPGAPLLQRLLDDALRLATDGARSRGHGQVRADQACYRDDGRLAGALESASFEPATVFHRMRRDLAEPIDVVLPDGVEVQRVDVEDDAALERSYRLYASTFRGHFGVEERPLEDYLAALRARTGTGPLWFATLHGEDVGFLHETAQFLEDEDAGYVWRLGVEDRARGRGVAQALLLSSFEGMRARGRSAALLHVDTANATGATRLYERVGMRAVVVIDVWRRTVPT